MHWRQGIRVGRSGSEMARSINPKQSLLLTPGLRHGVGTKLMVGPVSLVTDNTVTVHAWVDMAATSTPPGGSALRARGPPNSDFKPAWEISGPSFG
jgi:hypothetical protein